MSFMTFVIFTSLLLIIIFTLMNEYYQHYTYSHTHSLNSLNANLFNQRQSQSPHSSSRSSHERGCGEGPCDDYPYYMINKKKEQEKDGITILAYTAILAAIIMPNINQIE